MIITVALNPSIDKIVKVEKFEINKVHIIQKLIDYPGGKAVNVARALKHFKIPTKVLGFLGGNVGNEIIKLLNKEKINFDPVFIKGDSRENITILDDTFSKNTHLKGKGPDISEFELNRFTQKFEDTISSNQYFVFSGSVPPTIPKDIYLKLFSKIKGKNKFTILDAAHEALRTGVKASPFLISPNFEEFCQLISKDISDTDYDTIIREGKQVIKNYKVKNIVISNKDKNLVLLTENKNYLFNIPKVKIVDTIGSGDSLLAGILIGLTRNQDIVNSVIRGIATGASNVMIEGPGVLNFGMIDDLIKQVQYKEI